MKQQKVDNLNVGYTSIIIADQKSEKAPIMERITKNLNGQHKLVIDAAQISGVLKEIHFKG
jgi:hypothetical protein